MCSSDLEFNETELNKYKKELEELRKTVATQEETLNSKETMITWLNKQLNQNHSLTGLSQFRQTLAAASLNNSNLQPNHLLDKSFPLTSHSKVHSFDPANPALEIGGNNANSTVPSWMNLYNNNTGRSQLDSAILGNSSLNANASHPSINTNSGSANLNPVATGNVSSANGNGAHESASASARTQQDVSGKALPKLVARKPVRAPIWAKPNKKVTLEVGSNPTWKH